MNNTTHQSNVNYKTSTSKDLIKTTAISVMPIKTNNKMNNNKMTIKTKIKMMENKRKVKESERIRQKIKKIREIIIRSISDLMRRFKPMPHLQLLCKDLKGVASLLSSDL